MAENDGSETRAKRKQAVILRAAEEVFLTSGYLGASMDDVASRASVSKQTIYKHFGDKESLFHAVVTNVVETADPEREEQAFVVGDDLRADLRRIARRLLRGVMQDRVLQLRRVVIAEAVRFPNLGRRFYELGPGSTIDKFARAVEDLRDRGLVETADPTMAAEQLNWLILSPALNRAMLLGDRHGLTPHDLDRYADAGVETFLRAHGTPDLGERDDLRL